jgi:hypothetical protein
LVWLVLTGGLHAAEPADLWPLAQSQRSVHVYSTLFTSHEVQQNLATDEGIDAAIGWCRKTAVTKVYLESFRDAFRAERAPLEHARDRFRAAGFDVSGCVTTVGIGRRSSRSRYFCCYTGQAGQQELQEIFEFAASLFDEIMIDDFWCTDCACEECDAARKAKTATVGENRYPTAGDSWEDYRCELMVRLSQERILAPARRVNPKVRLIIKYPQWYDQFHERGYEVVRETADFDRIWVGTESRDYNDRHWGGTVQYESYFLMRWLGGLGGAKCGGGWFDPLGTTEKTYVEQARQTILGGARESMLFCYGALQGNTGPNDVEALRTNVPELLQVAAEVARRPIVGIAAYKPPNSHPEEERRVFDFVGMLGLPLVPCHEFPHDAQAAFFSVHALKDSKFVDQLSTFLATGKAVLVTDGLAKRLEGKINIDLPNVVRLPVRGEPKSLLALPQPELDRLREPLLRPFDRTFRAPNRVALYLFADGSFVAENFQDEPATVELDGQAKSVPARGWVFEWR